MCIFGPRVSLYVDGGPQNQSEYGWQAPEPDWMCIEGPRISPDMDGGLKLAPG